ncbi:hypothetical protein N1851_001746 [Merluccius polli]|uniref:ribonuclease H n=1 Tax=Merluccius polli TaxID=89951 RepID=A0AA47NB24_MERPO|nr:hypothetical protein N1851_001746 [Merluccius polli]
MLRTAEVLQAIKPGDWFTSIDLKDAYFHIPMARRHRQAVPAVCIRRPGLSIQGAPIRAALSPMQAKGLRILPYLDDWLICAQTRESAVHETAALLSHVTQLGLTVNYDKCYLTPNQVVVFLGMALPADDGLPVVAAGRQHAHLLLLLLRFQKGREFLYSLFLRLTGMLTVASAVVPLGLLQLRPLQVWMNGLQLEACAPGGTGTGGSGCPGSASVHGCSPRCDPLPSRGGSNRHLRLWLADFD